MKNIDKETQDKIIKIIQALMPTAKIYLFGSRARGTHDEWSDIDIALDTGVKIPYVHVDEIISILKATNIPYKIEVVDFQSVSQAMRDSIARDGIIWKN